MEITEKQLKIVRFLIIDILTALFIFTAITLIFNQYKKSKLENLSSSTYIKQFNKYFESKKVKLVYIKGSQDGQSTLQTSILKNITSDYNLDYLQLNKDKLNTNELNFILDKLETKKSNSIIAIVQNKNILAINQEFMDGTKLVDFLIQYEVLNPGSEYKAEKNLTIVDYDSFNLLYDSPDKFVIVLGQTSCSHCIAVKPVLSYIAGKNNITINYINLTNLTQTEYNSLVVAIKEMGYKEQIGTPLTLIIENKRIVDYLSGEETPAKFTRLFKNNDIIK